MEIPEGTPCSTCRAHKATITTADSMLDYSHGHYELTCECCYLRGQVLSAEEAVAQLAKLREKLARACDGQVTPDMGLLISENASLRATLRAQWVAAHWGLCGVNYPGKHAINYAGPHPEGEWCYWPEPGALKD